MLFCSIGAMLICQSWVIYYQKKKQKAFDYVISDIVWYKLIKLGIGGKILNIIMSMYKRVKSKVKLHNVVSEGFECMLGVRQGECLSPFRFAMYLNDLEEEFRLKGIDCRPDGHTLPPTGNFADIPYLKEQSFLHRIRDVCTLQVGAYACDSLLHMLPILNSVKIKLSFVI